MDSLIAAKHELLLEHAQHTTAGGTLIMALLRTAQLIDRACAEQLAAFDLSEARFAALLAAEEEDGATPASIAARLDVSRAAITGVLDGLVRQGLVTRTEDPQDRRSLTIEVTLAGHATLAALGPRYGEWLGDLTATLDPAHIADATAALGLLQRTLTEQRPRG